MSDVQTSRKGGIGAGGVGSHFVMSSSDVGWRTIPPRASRPSLMSVAICTVRWDDQRVSLCLLHGAGLPRGLKGGADLLVDALDGGLFEHNRRKR